MPTAYVASKCTRYNSKWELIVAIHCYDPCNGYFSCTFYEASVITLAALYTSHMANDISFPIVVGQQLWL